LAVSQVISTLCLGKNVTILIFCDIHRRGNDFSVGEAKIGEKQPRQSNSKYNVMHYVFIEKGIGLHSVQWGLGQAGEFSRIFALKVTLHSVRLLLTVS